MKRGALISHALNELVEQEAARRLHVLGGFDPHAWVSNEGDVPPVDRR